MRHRQWWSLTTGIAVVIDGGSEEQGARGEGDTGEVGRGCEGKGEANKGKRARADEGAWARAMVDMVDDNGKQQERTSDDGAARRRSSKINKIGCDHTYLFFLMLVHAHSPHPKKSGSMHDSAKDR